MSSEGITVENLIKRLWNAPEHAEWTPKTDTIHLSDLEHWMNSEDIEVLGFVDGMIHEKRFRIAPPLPIEKYIAWVMRYCGRCFRENPDGDWSDSSYSAGWELCRIFIVLWDDERVPRAKLKELKDWMASLYKGADERLRTCIVHATLEHLFERQPIRSYFKDWERDSLLTIAYREACLWDRKTPLSD